MKVKVIPHKHQKQHILTTFKLSNYELMIYQSLGLPTVQKRDSIVTDANSALQQTNSKGVLP